MDWDLGQLAAQAFLALLTAALLGLGGGLFRMWRIQVRIVEQLREMEDRVEKLDHDLDEEREKSLQETRLLRESCAELRTAIEKDAVRLKQLEREDERSFEYHERHFSKGNELQRQIDQMGKG